MSATFTFTEEELDRLVGLRWDAQLMYLSGIRRQMDFRTRIAGQRRIISRQYLRERLYVTPGPGIRRERTGPMTDANIRSALATLVRAGMIVPQHGADECMIFLCPFAPVVPPRSKTIRPGSDRQTDRVTSETFSGGNNDLREIVEPNPPQNFGQSNLPHLSTLKPKSLKHYVLQSPEIAPVGAAGPHIAPPQLDLIEAPSPASPAPADTPPPSPKPLTPGQQAKRAAEVEITEAAIRVIDFLNLRTGRNFTHRPKSLAPVVRSLKTGVTETECRQVIVRKCREWGSDPQWAKFLRPATLFGAENIEQYVGELGAPAVIPPLPVTPAVTR